MAISKDKKLSEQELVKVKELSGTITVQKLAEVLGWNYSNLSTVMKRDRIPFVSKRNPKAPTRKPDNNKMDKDKNSKGQKIVTDEMMNEWFYGTQKNSKQKD